jgi:hypothetical protein
MKRKVRDAYNAMLRRCYNPDASNYKWYGARGIVVCERWLNSRTAFILDMGMPPTEKHSLDRINPAGNYEPNNCRWATALEQTRNRPLMPIAKLKPGRYKTMRVRELNGQQVSPRYANEALGWAERREKEAQYVSASAG